MNGIKKILEIDKTVNKFIEERENKNLVGIYVIIWLVAFVFTVYNIIQKSRSMMISTGMLVLVLSIGLILNRLKKSNTMLRAIFTSLFFIMFSIYIIKGGNEGFASLWIVVFTYPLMVVIDLKMGFLCCLGWQILLFLFFVGPLHPYLQYEYSKMFLTRFPALYMAAFACATFIAVQFRKFQYYALTTNKELEYIGNYDELTGIYNLRGFRRVLDCMLEKEIAFVLLDVDDFKNINDSNGHLVGDQVLKKITEIMKETFRENDILARTGGDEFSVVLKKCNENEYPIIDEKLNKINEELKKQTDLPAVSISAGISFSQNGYSKALYEQADAAMYRAKRNGKSCCGKYYS